MHTLMRLMVELARVESEQMSRRRMDDISGYINLREAAARVLMAVQSLAAETTATPAPENQTSRTNRTIAASSRQSDRG